MSFAIIKTGGKQYIVHPGDKIKVDGIEFEVDAHYVLIDHGKTKEMTIEIIIMMKNKPGSKAKEITYPKKTITKKIIAIKKNDFILFREIWS